MRGFLIFLMVIVVISIIIVVVVSIKYPCREYAKEYTYNPPIFITNSNGSVTPIFRGPTRECLER